MGSFSGGGGGFHERVSRPSSPRPFAPPVARSGAPGRHRRRPPAVQPTEPERLERTSAGYAVTAKPTPTERPRSRAAPARPAAWLHRVDLATPWLHDTRKHLGQPRRISLSACIDWCRQEESNPRPSHYECAALPTELCRLRARIIQQHSGRSNHRSAQSPAPQPNTKNFCAHLQFVWRVDYTSRQFRAKETGPNQNAAPRDV